MKQFESLEFGSPLLPKFHRTFGNCNRQAEAPDTLVYQCRLRMASPALTKIIGPTDLFGFNDQTVFASCLAVAEAQGCVDIGLVHDYLAESGKLAEIDGPMGLLRYMEAVNHVAHAEFYARVVLKNSIRR